MDMEMTEGGFLDGEAGDGPASEEELRKVARCREMILSGRAQEGLLLVREVGAVHALQLVKLALAHCTDEIVRASSTIMLGQLQGADEQVHRACLELLLKLLNRDPDYGVRSAAAAGLGYLGDASALEALTRACYEDTEWQVQFSALVALGELQDERAFPVLLRALSSPNDILVQAAVGALGDIVSFTRRPAGVLPALLQLGKTTKDVMTRQRLACALGAFASVEELEPSDETNPDTFKDLRASALDLLRRLAQDEHQFVVEAAVESLTRAGEDGQSFLDAMKPWSEEMLEKSINDMLMGDMKNARDHLERSFGNGFGSVDNDGISSDKESTASTGALIPNLERFGASFQLPTVELQALYDGLGASDASQYDALLEQLRTGDMSDKTLAAIRLRAFPPALGLHAVLDTGALQSDSERVRAAVTPLLMSDPPLLKSVAFSDSEPAVRAAALDVMSQGECSGDVLNACIEVLWNDPHWLPRATSATALALNAHGFRPAEEALLQCIAHPNEDFPDMTTSQTIAIRRYAISALGALEVERSVTPLRAMFRATSDDEMKRCILASLASVRSRASLDALDALRAEEGNEGKSNWVREIDAARESLRARLLDSDR
ncbi:hypothetical protein FVE85_7356 [Porphyridium purpureum]|uniref:Uncharacterized protein n=1 Tax=Porphyridium purpureum TaxID=35688 RepID=A0A5J4Z773_PORPP|nr:hypothetical protein FVE85_7356 [Porphyridium purpureum]|eukprot:POR9837..scf295_1